MDLIVLDDADDQQPGFQVANWSHRKRKHESEKSIFDVIPDALLIEILIRLPLKCIHRYKCVSQHWLSLIAHPYFVRQYLRRISLKFQSMTPFMLYFLPPPERSQYFDYVQFFRGSQYKSSNLSLSFLPKLLWRTKAMDILASSNGLLLCSSDIYYIICNPLMGKWIKLPPAPASQSDRRFVVGFLCNPSYDEDHQTQFKVVRIEACSSFGRLNLEIYCSEVGNWFKLEVPCDRRIVLSYENGFVCNDILHWADANSELIFAYDPNRKVDQGRIIYLPKLPWDSNQCIQASQGRLRYIRLLTQRERDNVRPTLSVWDLKDYDKGEWHLEHEIYMDEMLSNNTNLTQFLSQPSLVLKALALHYTDKNILYLVSPNGIISYNIQTRTAEAVYYFDKAEKSSRLDQSYAFPFVVPWWPTPVPKLKDCVIQV